MATNDSPEAPDRTAPGKDGLVKHLCDLLDVQDSGPDQFIGLAAPDGKGRAFGGQVMGQALMAAGATAPDRLPHSLHAYFLRPGDNALPILFDVKRDLDGSTFSNRRVVASQNGKPILTMLASFHNGDCGFTHCAPMPDVPGPDDAVSDADWAAANPDAIPSALRARIARPRPIEIRRLNTPMASGGKAEDAAHAMWVRTATPPVAASQLMHRAILVFLSDMGLMSTALRPHGVNWSMPGLQGASIDHAVWFHNPVDAGQWMLYAMESPWADHGRGMNRGQIFARDGQLLASTAQEGLNRIKGSAATG